VPAQFQEAIRADFPKYAEGYNQKDPNEKCHVFMTVDEAQRITLTHAAITFETPIYQDWAHFNRTLDKPLGEFISLYQPLVFERIGLRYVNAFSRELLGLEDRPWNELLQPEYLGILDNDDIDESTIEEAYIKFRRVLSSGDRLQVHAGPGIVTHHTKKGDHVEHTQETVQRFIFDQDLSRGETAIKDIVPVLTRLHDEADDVFDGAMTNLLRNAMGPNGIEE
jgi:uncharacterized protein (TIGR04255 family)